MSRPTSGSPRTSSQRSLPPPKRSRRPKSPRRTKSLPPSKPIAVAITGGIGAGKSEALKAFARRGAETASSDEIVHRLLAGDEEVKREVVERFGSEVLDGSGAIDRAALARVVFADRGALAALEAILHPRVVREYSAWHEELGRRPDPPRVAVVEVPLLYETGGERRFDKVVVITASPEVRAARTEVADAREERLLPDEEKLRRADFAYVNDGSLEGLDRFVGEVLERLS